VILVGEMRDRESWRSACRLRDRPPGLSTLHTMDAGQTVNRILGLFETNEERQIRMRLAATLRWIVLSAPLPKVEVAGWQPLEVMGMNSGSRRSS